MIIEVTQKLTLTEEDSRDFIDLMRQAIMSSDPSDKRYAEPLSFLLSKAKVTGEIDLKDFKLDCGNAQE